MEVTLTNRDDLRITTRELIAGAVAVISFFCSLAFGYGIKAQQVNDLQTIVVRHDNAIVDLTKELTQLRLVVAALNGTLQKDK